MRHVSSGFDVWGVLIEDLVKDNDPKVGPPKSGDNNKNKEKSKQEDDK